MLTDKKWYFQDDVGTAGDDISATTTAEISSQIIDLHKTYGSVDIANNGFFDGDTDFTFVVRCKTLGQAGTLTVNFKDSNDGSTFATIASQVVASAANVANAIVCRLRIPPGCRRYIRCSFTNGTSGTNVYNAWICPS
jgi:hypothetical protein